MLHRSLQELALGLQKAEFSSRELTAYYLARMRHHNPHLNTFITICDELALAQADAADVRRARGQAGPLNGIPIAHKDIFCTEGVRTTCASKMLHNFISPYNATCVQRLQDRGVVMLGKTNMDEFAMGSSNETSYFGPVRNPWQTHTVPGGSSGGSAAAVAARLAPACTGTDTGGSIRQPAAMCGITGLKPTYGRVSRYGMIAFASSLDQAGPMCQSAYDAALLLNAMVGHDPLDSTSLDYAAEDFTAGIAQPLDGLKIGLPDEYFAQGIDPGVEKCVQAAIREFEKMGAKVKRISLPNAPLSVPTYYVLAPAECSSNLSRFDGVRFGHRCENPANLDDLYTRSRAEGFGDEVKRRILVGTYVLSKGFYDAYYLKAQKLRQLISADFKAAFKEVDVIMSPTAPTVAFPLGAKIADPVKMYLCDINTIAVNLAGLPGMSIPCGFEQNMPVGLQLIGTYFTEARLLNVAHQYQLRSDWHRQIPKEFQA